MGLFSKETVTCKRCGKEFQTRFGAELCPSCYDRDIQESLQREDNVQGYMRYAKLMKWPAYTPEQLVSIGEHRDRIFEKYRRTDGITKTQLKEADANRRSLQKDDAMRVVYRAICSRISATNGASYSEDFFLPNAFERTIVDAKDVFAVAYATDYNFEAENSEVILCIVFTNDPYIPVFPMIYLGDIGFFEIAHSKKGRTAVQEDFQMRCPNLTYPVQTVRLLKNQLKAEKTVHGNIKMDDMLRYLSDAMAGVGVFQRKVLTSELSQESDALLEEYGYIQEADICKILKLNSASLFDNYWKKLIRKRS